MGYPELPPDGGEFPSDTITNFNPPTSEDSDNNETINVDPDSPYSGYQQLTFDGENYSGNPINGESDDENDEIAPTITPTPTPVASYPPDFGEIECGGSGNSFPDVVPVDIELAQSVWNAPPEASRSNTIQLDDTRTNQIINLMSGISLPQNSIPEWARNLPEDKWKQELLEKIRGGGAPSDTKPSGGNK